MNLDKSKEQEQIDEIINSEIISNMKRESKRIDFLEHKLQEQEKLLGNMLKLTSMLIDRTNSTNPNETNDIDTIRNNFRRSFDALIHDETLNHQSYPSEINQDADQHLISNTERLPGAIPKMFITSE